MDSFILHVRRQSAFTAATAATKVIVDGGAVATLHVGGVQDFTLPRKVITVTLLTQVALSKDIQTTVTIDPRDSAEVTLLFTYRFNPKSLLPFGAFSQQQSFIDTQVIHGIGASRTAASSVVPPTPNAAPQAAKAAVPPTPSASPAGDKKFCTECGTPNPKTAKFCQGCGHKF